jgi:hypothetical protein
MLGVVSRGRTSLLGETLVQVVCGCCRGRCRGGHPLKRLRLWGLPRRYAFRNDRGKAPKSPWPFVDAVPLCSSQGGAGGRLIPCIRRKARRTQGAGH